MLLKIPEDMERLAVGQTKVYELMSSGERRAAIGEGRPVPPGAERLTKLLTRAGDGVLDVAATREALASHFKSA